MSDSKEREISYAEAIREGLELSMSENPQVIIIGEGVPDPKAIFNTTAGLRSRFGENRVFDMPLSENGITGVCIGAAISGMRPVMVHQRIDFSLLAMDQIVNNAAKWYYMFDGQSHVPLVIRMIIGRGWGQGPQHSQSLQAMFGQVPGLKVIMPTTAYDAKGMLISAIEDDGPVIFIEHRWLHNVRDHVPDVAYRVPLNKARRLHEGQSLTIAAFSYMALEAFWAAKALKEYMDISVDVLDMRSVRPLDIEAVIDSLKKTGRLIVADTGSKTGGIAGELIAQVVEQAFDILKSPPLRVVLPDFPAPTSPFMTEGYYPEAQAIAKTVLQVLSVKKDSDRYARTFNSLRRKASHDTPNPDFMGPF